MDLQRASRPDLGSPLASSQIEAETPVST